MKGTHGFTLLEMIVSMVIVSVMTTDRKSVV